MASSDVSFGPYIFPKRSLNALGDYGIDKPVQLDGYTIAQLRKIPGFGETALAAVRLYRRTRNNPQAPSVVPGVLPEDELDLGFPDEDITRKDVLGNVILPRNSENIPYPTNPGSQREPCRVEITLVEGEHQLKKAHFEWLVDIMQITVDPLTGGPMTNVASLIALLIKSTYGNDATKGGTRGVTPASGNIPANGQIGAVTQDFTPNLGAPIPTAHLGVTLT